MNENLDLLKILRLYPRGSRFYLSVIGSEVEFISVIDKFQYPIKVRDFKHGREFLITKNGRFFEDYLEGECVLFPSKDQRDWSKFKAPAEKFDYSTLKPFDKVLVRDSDSFTWKCALFTCMKEDSMTCSSYWRQGIPYNEETKHLAGATDKPDEKYIWWED